MTTPRMSPRAGRLGTLAIWLATAAVLCVLARAYISGFTFRDADDALRLVEVRDWLGGQGWFDVTQHRIFPPQGVPMHWSRLVDLPLGAGMAFLSLFTGRIEAERITMVVVPLLTLLALFATVHALTARTTGRQAMAVTGSALLALSPGIMIQFLPMRIDHHGWQILLDSLAALFAIRALATGRRDAAIAGLAMAASLAIAIEGLPVAVAIAGALAFALLRGRAPFALLGAYLASLTLSCAALLLATRGVAQSLVPWCDALSPAYLAPMAAATATLLAAAALLRPATPVRALACLALAGLAGGLAFLTAAPQCVAGPFAQLDPIVYEYWYRSVGEGMPVWTLPPDAALLVPIPALVGLIGSALALRGASAARREAWIALFILQVASFAVSMMVIRAMGIAHALAVPGAAFLFLTAFDAAMRGARPLIRVVLGFACFLVTPVGAEMVVYSLVTQAPDKDETPERKSASADCAAPDRLKGLDALSPSLLFAPLDIGPDLLVYTRHSLVATGHHRNQAGMKIVLTAFLATPEEARPIVTRTGARYLAFCNGMKEVKKFVHARPHGLMAALAADRPPDWLERMPMPRGETLQIYRIVYPPAQAGRNARATPFMQ